MNKKILFLSSIFVLLLVALLVLYIQFISNIKDAKNKKDALLIQQLISSDLENSIFQIQSRYYKIILVANKPNKLELDMQKLDQKLSDIKEIIMLLKEGGHYRKKLSLNIIDQEKYIKKYYYSKPSLSIEVTHLEAKVELLIKKQNILKSLIKKRMYIALQRKKRAVELIDIRLEIEQVTKSLDSIFRSMLKDSNKLFYEAQVALSKHNTERKEHIRQYGLLVFSVVFFLLALFAIGVYQVISALQLRLYKDNLTKLYSRVKLEETIFTKNTLLLLVDIDDFSDINSLYGIEVGDGVLKHFSQKIKDFDPSAEHFRVAGDVFALHYPIATQDTDAIVAKIKALQWYLHHSHCPEHICKAEISVTVGAAIGKNCLHDAFMALDIANTKHEPYRIFSDESDFREEIEFNRLWHSELSLALENDSIMPFYQPIINQDMRIVKHEALMRLGKIVDGEVVYIPPVYLDVAIRTKQYLPLSRSMIRKTFILFANEIHGAFSINISYQDINTQSSRDFLKHMIVEYGVAGRVTFEILESSFVDSYDLLKIFISEFQAYGAKFAIDDFGSGYSNAKRVISLNPDYIKIDGELIKHMLDDRKSYKMIENIVSYAKEFDIATVAEHVSSMEIFLACKELNINYFQGFLFAKPAKELQTQISLNA